MSHTLELPDTIYTALVKAAQESGTTPVAWIEENLSKPYYGKGAETSYPPTHEEIARANAHLDQYVVSLGYATGSSNSSIDADLVREYGNDHSSLYHKEKD